MKLRMHSFLVLAAMLSGCATVPGNGLRSIPPEWQKATPTERIGQLSLDGEGKVTLGLGPRIQPEVQVVHDDRGDRLMRGSVELTPPFPAINSFDVSNARKEVVFSARRAGNFDIGLVALEGSAIHWVPEDPLDEVDVQWAPRGNKVSYVVRAAATDLVRTVHIPTATQLTVDLSPYASVSGLAWDPQAERFAVAYDTPSTSSRVEVMKYGGESRKVVIPPSVELDVEIESIGGAMVLRPRALRYGERLPLVIWIDDSPRARWDDARGRLLQTARVACAILPHEPEAGFREAAGVVPWIDSSRVFVVGGAGKGFSHAVSIRGTEGVPAGRYRMEDDSVLVAPGIVKSFAARFIAEQMKGNASANGSNR